MTFFYDRIVILCHNLSSKSRNSKVFTHSEFKMALSFVITETMPEHKKTGILSLNVKIDQFALSLELQLVNPLSKNSFIHLSTKSRG